MSQQMVNGSERKGDVTITIRMTDRYAVVSPPFSGKHKKPQTDEYKIRRKAHWKTRNSNLRRKGA